MEEQNKTARNESPMVVLVSENNRTKSLLVAAYSWSTSTDTRISYIHRYSGVVVLASVYRPGVTGSQSTTRPFVTAVARSTVWWACLKKAKIGRAHV